MRRGLLSMLLAMVVTFTSVDMAVYATNDSPVSVETEAQEAQEIEVPGIEVQSSDLSHVSAANGRIENEQGGIDWAINSEGVLTVKGKGNIAEDNINGTLIPWSGKDFTTAVIELEEVTDLSYFFADCKKLTSVDFSKTDTGYVTDMSYMFNDCWELKTLDLSAFDTADVTTMQGMFSGCKNLREVKWDSNKFDTSNVTNMNSMFMGCIHLTKVDVTGFNTGNVTDMSSMFRSCAKLPALNLSNFNTSKVTTMENMFWECTTLAELNLSSFNTAQVTNMSEMFKGCSDLTALDVSSFHTANVTDMANLFSGCMSLKNLDLSSFDMSKVAVVGTFIGGTDFLSNANTALESIRTPKNLKSSVTLPAATGETWYDAAGTRVTSLPQNSGESVLLQKNKQAEKGLAVAISDTSARPVITITFDQEVSIKEFSLKIDNNIVLNTQNWSQDYQADTRKVTWQPAEDLAEGNHTLELNVEDQSGHKLGTPVTRTFFVQAQGGGSETPDTPTPSGEIISKVVVVVNDNYIRVRAWSPFDDVKSVEASVTEKYTDSAQEETQKCEMSLTNGYYTCLIPRNKQELSEVTVTVKATNEKGESHTTEPVKVAVEADLDDDQVINDLWVKFVDGNGSEKKEYIYSGKAIKPQIEVYEGTTLLTLNKDYTVSYKNNKNAGTATLSVKGKGTYTKNAEVQFIIHPKEIANRDINAPAQVTIDAMAAVEKNKVQKLVPVIKYGTIKLSNSKNRDFKVTYPDTAEGAYQKAGTWNVVVEGQGNYCGEITLEYNIGGKLAKSLKVKNVKAQAYKEGSEVKIENLEVYDKNKLLKEDTDYTVRYLNNINAGTATLIIEGIGPAYVGTKSVNFKIEGIALSKTKISLPTGIEYTGQPLTPKVTVNYNGTELVEKTDYLVNYTKNTVAGTASVEITGTGGFTGKVKKSFKIAPFDVLANGGGQLSVQAEEKVPYLKSGAKAAVTVTFNGKKLTEGTDYQLSYAKNKAAGNAEVKIKFKKNFKGTIPKAYEVEKQDISLLNFMTQDMAVSKKKNSWKSKVVVWDLDGKSLAAGKDFEKVTTYYTDQACTTAATQDTYEVGTQIWVKVIGKGNYTGELIESYQIKPGVITKAKVKIGAKEYTGYPVYLEEKEITVKVGSDTLVPVQDYRIVENSYRNNIKKGTAQVTIEGVGNYGGTYTAKFAIKSKTFDWRYLPILRLFFQE